jgi:hypothetical protein
MALPRRCAASLRLAGQRPFPPQVSDLPLRSQTANPFRANIRQVADLPRIGVAEPSLREPTRKHSWDVILNQLRSSGQLLRSWLNHLLRIVDFLGKASGLIKRCQVSGKSAISSLHFGNALQNTITINLIEVQIVHVHIADVTPTRLVAAKPRAQSVIEVSLINIADRLSYEVAASHRAVAIN